MRPSAPSIVSLDSCFCLCTTGGRVSCETMTRGTCAPSMCMWYVAFLKNLPLAPTPHRPAQATPTRLYPRGPGVLALSVHPCRDTVCVHDIAAQARIISPCFSTKPQPFFSIFWAMPHFLCLLACPDLCCIHALSLPAAPEAFTIASPSKASLHTSTHRRAILFSSHCPFFATCQSNLPTIPSSSDQRARCPG
jgi:hypothetical protein